MNVSEGHSTVREPSLQQLIPAMETQWSSGATLQNFEQRMFEHYKAHNPEISEIKEEFEASMDQGNQATKNEEARTQQAMKDNMNNLVEMLRQKTHQRRSSQVKAAGGQQAKISLQSSIEDEALIAGNQQYSSVTDIRSTMLQEQQLNGQSQTLGNKGKHTRAKSSCANTARSFDMTRRTARGGTQSNLEQFDTAVGSLFFTNVMRCLKKDRCPSNQATSQVGQLNEDVNFTDTVVLNDQTQQYYSIGGKVFMQRPVSQNEIQSIIPQSQRQIQSQLALIKPGTTRSNDQWCNQQDALRILNQQSGSDGQMPERTSESETQNNTKFLARSNKPNHANLNYLQKQMKLNKNQSSRPITSNVLLGSSSIGDTGNFDLGRSCAIPRKPAKDFIIKNKESVTIQNKTQLVQNNHRIPIMATVTTKRKTLNPTFIKCNEKRKTKAANTVNISNSASRSRTRSAASPRDYYGHQTRKSSPLGVSSRLQRADFRIKRGDKNRRQSLQSSNLSKNKSNANTKACSTKILVSASTVKVGRGRRDESANSLNKSINNKDQMERSKVGASHHSPLAWVSRDSGQERRTSAHSLYQHKQSQQNMKKSRFRTAKGAIQNRAANLPTSIQQQSRETLTLMRNQKRSCEILKSGSLQRGQTRKMLIQEQKRHTLVPLNTHYKNKRQIPTKIEVQKERIETASYEAAHEKHGLTQNRHGDNPQIFQESALMNVDGVETGKTRQQQIDDIHSNCHNQVLKAEKNLALEVGFIEMPAATNREGSRDNQHCRGFVEASSNKRLAISRGNKCGQCTDCINNANQGVSPDKVMLSQIVGNSNRQKLEVLKPKWVGNMELRQVPDDAQMVFKLRGPELFERQLPMLITACLLYVKRMFKAELKPLDYSTIASNFFMNHVENPQLQRSATLQALSDKTYAEKLYQKMMARNILMWRAHDDSKLHLDQMPVIIVITTEGKELNQINELQTMITAIISEKNKQGETFQSMLEPQSQQVVLYQDIPQRTKADQIQVFDPQYAEDTIISKEWFHQMELTILVVYQFQSRVAAYLRKRAQYHRQMIALGLKNSFYVKADLDQLKIQSNQAEEEPIILDFFDIDEITELRTRENRAEIYKKASDAMPALIETYRELDIMTAQIEDTAFNTDYQALEKLNNKFDDAFDMDEPRLSKLVSLKTNFADFFERHLSDPNEVRAQTEVETIDKIGQPHLSRIQSTFCPLFKSLQAPERVNEEKYKNYADHIFVKYAPLSNPVDDMANLGLIEQHYTKPETRRTRKQLETEIYRCQAFPLLSERVLLPGVTYDLVKSHLHYLADVTADNTTVSLEQQQTEIEELNRLDESKHTRLVQGYERRLHPVEHLMSQSSLHTASFYREEFALPICAFAEEEKYCELATRFEILQVYTLISSQKTPWFDKSPFHQQVLKKVYQARLELNLLSQRRELGYEEYRDIMARKNRVKVEQQKKDLYRATIQQLYRKNLVLILERENQDESQTEKAKSGKLGAIIEQVDEEVATSIMISHTTQLQLQQEQKPNLLQNSSRASLNVDDSKCSIDGLEESPAKGSLATESAQRQVQSLQIKETEDDQTEKEIPEESKESEAEDLIDLFSDSGEESIDQEPLQATEVKTNPDYVVSDDDDSSDDDYVGIKLTNTSYDLRMALIPSRPVQNGEKDHLSSDCEEEQKLDSLIETLVQQEAPATKMRDVNRNLLEHPDFEQLNYWMDSGTNDLCYSWDEQERKALQEPKFDFL